MNAEDEYVRDLLISALRILDATGHSIPAVHVATALSAMGYEVPSHEALDNEEGAGVSFSVFGRLDKGKQS